RFFCELETAKTMPKKTKFPYLVGSKWTSQQTTWGWRHFQVVNRKNEGSWVFAEMVAACDPMVRFWMNAKLLKDASQWSSGWKSLQEQEELESEDW
ncbi:MAG: TIGR02450 family Trp-rich protein, partial [Geitlerinemataceae cyanobacterium]